MEQTITINVPEGKVAKYNETTQTIEFLDKGPIRSKSWEGFCENHPDISNEYFITSDGRIEDYDNSVRLITDDKTLLSSKKDAEGILALIQLTRLHDEWVGYWKPDYATYYSVKYSKASEMVVIISDNYGLLIFPTMDMAIEFKDCFKHLLLKAKKFI